MKRSLSAYLSIGAQHLIVKLEQEVPSDSSILCEMKVFESGRLTLSYTESYLSNPIKLVIRDTSNDTSFTIQVHKDAYVESLFREIHRLKGYPISDQRLLLDGERLDPDFRFRESE